MLGRPRPNCSFIHSYPYYPVLIINPKRQNHKPQTTNYKPLSAYIKISQRIIQACLEISTCFALTNDQCTSHLVFAGREFLSIASWYNDAAGWHPAFIFNGITATHINDLSTLSKHHVCAQYSFFFNNDAFYHNTPASNKATILNDYRRSL